MSLNDVTNPQIGEMTIRVTYAGTAREFTRFTEYRYREHYLEASDCWEFALPQKELSALDLAVLVPGATVEPCIDGNVQSRGIIDTVDSTAARSEGNVVRIEGRDWLSMAVDCQPDPALQFNAGMTLLDMVVKALSTINPNITVFADDIANRNVITGRIYGQRTTKKGKIPKKILLGLCRPYPNEGLFAFVSRVAQRFGLWLRPYVDGESVVLAAPDFDQPVRYGIRHVVDGDGSSNNVERGSFVVSRKDQPSILYAYGTGGGGTFPHAALRTGVTNPVVNADNSAVINAYPSVRLIDLDPVTFAFPPLVEGAAKPAFIHDPESKTQEQIESFAKRELALRMRKALSARYEFMGHKLNGQPVAVNTMVSVFDQQPTVKWNAPLWVLAREFKKDARGGARTTIELVLAGAIQF